MAKVNLYKAHALTKAEQGRAKLWRPSEAETAAIVKQARSDKKKLLAKKKKSAAKKSTASAARRPPGARGP